ncbi:MAG: polysulfide reductase NrfD [Acidobacteriota bacterium]|nr:polysulfide reductase NrfD [Acidobacteriota bacterium]
MTEQPNPSREARLEAIREEAARTGRAAGAGVVPANGPMPAATGAGTDGGYYNLPLLKAPVWTWEVPLYFFIGGVAGASEAIALAARISTRAAALERAALWIAVIGALVCPLLLIADLGRPGRFLNMLRVFKWRSPMSVGAWTLVKFSGVAIVAVVANEALHAGIAPGLMGVVTWVAEIGGAVLGLLLLSYTAVLLGVTAVPVWSQNRRLLPGHFVASSIGSASSMLELLGFLVPATQIVGLAASVWETIVGISIEVRGRAVDDSLRRGRSGWAARIGGTLAGPLALGLRIFESSSAEGREFAAVCFVAGALTSRYAWLWAGRASAGNARALFDLQRGR